MTGRILLVEDQRPLRRVLELSLAARGFEVDQAATGQSALDVARRRPPDLIILDLGLPDMDGVEVITEVRAFASVPILVISARDAGLAEVRALAAGADGYLAKPFAIGDLVGRVRAALAQACPAGAGTR